MYFETERDGEHRLYTVGFYDPAGKWQAEQDFPNRDDAAARVHFLNGGSRDSMTIKKGARS